MFTCCRETECQHVHNHSKLATIVTMTAGGRLEFIPASSRLSSLTLEASDTLLPPLRSHGQQLGDLVQDMAFSK